MFLFQTVGRVIVPDIIFRDRTCLVFCFLGCAVKFQAREAIQLLAEKRELESWQSSLCAFCLSFFLFFFFSFLLLAFFLLYLSFIKLVKPVRHNTNCLKKNTYNYFKKMHFNDLTSSNKQGRCEKARKSLKETDSSSPLHSICELRINV